MPDPLLMLRRLAVSAGGRRLVESFDLDLHTGEIVALTGPSGSGKTTLLRAIAGLIDPDAGDVRFGGRSREEIGWPAYRRSVMLVPQQPVMLDATVEVNLSLPWTYRVSRGKPFPRGAAIRLLDDVGVGGNRLVSHARSLSVGEQQRVALVRSLLLEPAVLLLDEPTSALDDESVARVERTVRHLAENRGVAALVTLHDHDQVRRWTDRSIAINVAPTPAMEASGR